MAIAVRGTPPPRDDADDDRVDDAPRASKTGRREGDGRRDGCGRRGDDEATTTTTTTRKTRGDVDAVRTVGEILRGANSNADVKGVVMRATLGLRRRDDASGGWTWTANDKDEDGGAEVRLASVDVKAHDLGRVVCVRDFVVVTDARNGDAVVVEANCVERAYDDDGFEESLACGPLEDEDGVANDARALNGKLGACHRGILEAVSPIITTGESTFFMCALRNEDDAGAQIPIIFNGEFLARWECILRQCVGSRVEMRNLRKVVLFKGDATHELRAFSATAEFHVVSLTFGERRVRRCACACAMCGAGATVDRFEGHVVSVRTSRAYAILRDAQGRDVKLTFTHVPLVDSKIVVSGLRVGARVVVTHAHPVWRVDEYNERVVETLGVDLRTQIVIKRTSTENASEGETEMYSDDADEKANRFSRVLKYVVEQSNFVYAEAAAAWREVFETNFDILNDSRLIDVASAEYALGKTGEASDEQTAAPLLLAMHDLGSKAFERADVYREFFAPTPLGGESISNFDVPTINSLKDAVFEKWKYENKVAAACKRGSTRNEGKVVIRATGRLGEVDPPRYVMGILRCMYGRLHVVDASGAVELCIESFLKRAPAPSMLNKLVVLRECEIMCEGAYVGSRADALNHHNASVRVSLCVDSDNIVVIQNPTSSAKSESHGTMYVAVNSATKGAQLLPPRLASSKFSHPIVAPTWTFTIDASSEVKQRTSIQVYTAQGGVKTLDGVMVNTTHESRSSGRIAVSFGPKNSWFCLLRHGTTYLIPIVPTLNSGATTFIVDEHPDVDAFVLPDDEDDEMTATPEVRDVRDVLVWGKVFAKHLSSADSWQPSPELVSFRCIIVAEEWFESENRRESQSQFGWEPRFKVQDVETHDVVDVYCKTSAFSLPVGVGIGAKITIHRAMRHLSAASMNIYVKLNPGVTTIEIHERCASTSEYLPLLTNISMRQSIRALFDEEMRNSGERLVISRRTFAVRARVVSVSMLTVRWCCPACGCDAGSLMHVSVNPATGATKRRLPAVLAGCDVCRPSARGTSRPGVFEVEASVILDDGTAQADCWLTGEAGMALTPLEVRNEILAIVKKHGRVTSRLIKSSDEERDLGAVTGGHVVRGHASNVLGGKDSAAVRTAVSYATSLNEMIFECRKQYRYHDGEDSSSPPHASAFSFAIDPKPREVRVGEYAISTNCLPMLRFWSASAIPTRPKEELMMRLSQINLLRAS